MKHVVKIAECPFCKAKGSEILIHSEFHKHENRFCAWLECPHCLCDGPLAYSKKDDETARNNAKKRWTTRGYVKAF